MRGGSGIEGYGEEDYGGLRVWVRVRFVVIKFFLGFILCFLFIIGKYWILVIWKLGVM